MIQQIFHIAFEIKFVTIVAAVQNERDRISSRRPSYEEPVTANGLTINVLINAETMSRQVNLFCFSIDAKSIKIVLDRLLT